MKNKNTNKRLQQQQQKNELKATFHSWGGSVSDVKIEKVLVNSNKHAL